MNIFDLSWCKFYLYDERHNTGFPLVGASISMTFFVGLFAVGLIMFPSAIGVYKLPDLSFLPFGIGLALILSFFIFRHRNDDIRKRRLLKYKKYEKEHPAKSRFRFLMVIVIPILLFISDFTIANIRYNLLQGF